MSARRRAWRNATARISIVYCRSTDWTPRTSKPESGRQHAKQPIAWDLSHFGDNGSLGRSATWQNRLYGVGKWRRPGGRDRANSGRIRRHQPTHQPVTGPSGSSKAAFSRGHFLKALFFLDLEKAGTAIALHFRKPARRRRAPARQRRSHRQSGCEWTPFSNYQYPQRFLS